MEVDHKFDMETFSKSQRCMNVARTLFPSVKDQEAWALLAYERWQSEGMTPEQQRNKRNPNWERSYELIRRRSKTKVLYY